MPKETKPRTTDAPQPGGWLSVGVDPGRKGAVAGLTSDGLAWGKVVDTKEPDEINAAMVGLYTALWKHAKTEAASYDTRVFIEDVFSRPGEGHKGVFSFGRAKGTVHGWMSREFKAERVSFILPQRWQSEFFGSDLHGVEADMRKEMIRKAAKKRWPKAPLSAVQDEAVAAALYIAACGARTAW